jgi:ADP-heptose:LPS heptosyltransferase
MRRLLIRPGAIGDFILSLPAMEALRSEYTEVWCAGQNVSLAGFADAAHSIISAGLDRLGFLPADDVIEQLRSFDSIVSWYGANRPEFQQLTVEMGLDFQFLSALPDGKGHAVDFYNNQVRMLGAIPSSRYPTIPCPAVRRSFAAVHPFASSMAKRAPMKVFSKAAERLSDHMPVHWLCGPEEELDGAVQIPNLFDLACWLRGARVFVGNDSGISHLAAAVGTPVMAFFRTTAPGVWTPRGSSVSISNVSAEDASESSPSHCGEVSPAR